MPMSDAMYQQGLLKPILGGDSESSSTAVPPLQGEEGLRERIADLEDLLRMSLKTNESLLARLKRAPHAEQKPDAL